MKMFSKVPIFAAKLGVSIASGLRTGNLKSICSISDRQPQIDARRLESFLTHISDEDTDDLEIPLLKTPIRWACKDSRFSHGKSL